MIVEIYTYSVGTPNGYCLMFKTFIDGRFAHKSEKDTTIKSKMIADMVALQMGCRTFDKEGYYGGIVYTENDRVYRNSLGLLWQPDCDDNWQDILTLRAKMMLKIRLAQNWEDGVFNPK